MTMCATSAGLRSVALRERSHNNNPELAGILDSVAEEMERLTRELIECQAALLRMTNYRDGLLVIEKQKDAEIARLTAALNAKSAPEAVLLQASTTDGAVIWPFWS